MKNDIIIKEKDYKFNFRVAVVFINNDKILIQKNSNDDYYSLIGGRVKYGETTKSAIIREIEEEIGIKTQESELKLLNVVENFFVYDAQEIHELLFIYVTEHCDLLKNKDNIFTIDKENSVNLWYKISDLNNIDLRPKLIIDSLKDKKLKHTIVKN